MARDAVLVSSFLALLMGVPPALAGVIGAATGLFYIIFLCRISKFYVNKKKEDVLTFKKAEEPT